MARGRFRFINVAGLFRWIWPVFLKPELEARSKAGSKAAPPFVGERWGRWVAGARCKYVRVSSVAASMRLRAPATHRPQRFQNWLVRLDSRQRQEPERCTGFRWGRKSCRAWLGNTNRSRGLGSGGALVLALAFAGDFAVPCEPTHCPRAGLCGCRGRVLPWMATPSLQGWIYGVPRKPTQACPPRHRREIALAVAVAVAVDRETTHSHRPDGAVAGGGLT